MWLHIGCGNGRLTYALAQAFPRWHVSVLDSDSELAAKACHRLSALNQGLRVTRADPPDLPYPDSSFDLVIAANVWHRLPQWRTVTVQAHRVLRSGGTLLLTDLKMPRLPTLSGRSTASRSPQPSVAATLADRAESRLVRHRIRADPLHRDFRPVVSDPGHQIATRISGHPASCGRSPPAGWACTRKVTVLPRPDSMLMSSLSCHAIHRPHPRLSGNDGRSFGG
ncbi:MAG TPA: class I SAM-dependent methyltransferase [Candidatus Limnocylindrales bacterium]|nr:class I SAM-dependent methyltransferase [Candidatus Limnocylindrales bacterium]